MRNDRYGNRREYASPAIGFAAGPSFTPDFGPLSGMSSWMSLSSPVECCPPGCFIWFITCGCLRSRQRPLAQQQSEVRLQDRSGPTDDVTANMEL